MSVRENIQLYPGIDVENYIEVLKSDFGAEEHPSQPDAFLVDELPFYYPQQTETNTCVLGFNYLPLSGALILALIKHPEFFPDGCIIRWTQEQELILELQINKP